MQKDKLPDQLGPSLNVVFVGTAAGKESAAKGHYYAKPGNRFWGALHEAGLTARPYEPEEFAKLLEHGIGMHGFVQNGSRATIKTSKITM